MPKVNLKKGRPKSYEEKLLARQERMNMIDRPEAVFMPGENLSDNEEDNQTPTEVVTKKEVMSLVEEDETLPEIKIRKKKSKKATKPKIIRIAADKFAVKIDNSVKLTIKAPAAKKTRPSKNKMSFREKLLLANTEKLRSTKNIGDKQHIAKWAVKHTK